MQDASDIPTRHTLDWLRPLLGPAPQRILEVGCGRGEVAAGLVADGHNVVAIDSDADCVERARARGVTAKVMEYPNLAADVAAQRFDAVLFTRVLHHIADLSAANECAASLLAPGGQVLLEDFAWEYVDEATASWAFGLLRIGLAAGIVPAGEWDWDATPLEAWREPPREHGLHTGAAMLAALAGRFTMTSTEGAAYAYRWFARYLTGHERGAEIGKALLDAEQALIETGTIVAVGLRAVAQLPAPDATV